MNKLHTLITAVAIIAGTINAQTPFDMPSQASSAKSQSQEIRAMKNELEGVKFILALAARTTNFMEYKESQKSAVVPAQQKNDMRENMVTGLVALLEDQATLRNTVLEDKNYTLTADNAEELKEAWKTCLFVEQLNRFEAKNNRPLNIDNELKSCSDFAIKFFQLAASSQAA